MSKKRIRNTLLCILALLAALFPSLSFAQELPFADGEEVKLVIHYKWGFSADIGEIDVVTREITAPEGAAFHVVATASTYRRWDSFFKVRDRYETKFLSDGGLTPFYFYRDVNEGSFWAKNHFSWENGGKTLQVKVDKKGYPHREFTYREKSVVRDLLNLFYSTRSVDLDKLLAGHRVNGVLCVDKDPIDYSLRFAGREEKKISGLGRVKTVKVAVALSARKGKGSASDAPEDDTRFSLNASSGKEEGKKGDGSVYYGEEKIFIWYSDDENRLPVYFSAPVSVGSINGRLASCKGLRYPFTSLTAK